MSAAGIMSNFIPQIVLSLSVPTMNFEKKVFLTNIAQTNAQPLLLKIHHAEGLYLVDTEGKRYMDLISGIAVSNIGHRHPKVVAQIKDQLDKHLHVMVYGEYIQSTPNLLAEKLAQLLPPGLDCVYFVNSGTEANEGALKLAKRVTGRTEIVSFSGAYHGSTHGSLSISGNEVKKCAFRPLLPNVRVLPFNDREALQQITEETACVIAETVQGDAGVRIPTKEYFQALRKRCDDTGALLILDEIQTGFGRTGTWFAFEHFGIQPDIVTMAKAMGGGLPLGAFVSSYEKMQTLTHDPMLGHITTFGGNPLSCAASLATVEVIEDDNLLQTVESKGRLFEKLLQHPGIKEIRRIGLMFALQFDSANTVQKIVQNCLSKGVVCFWFLSCPDSFRIAPPLTITEEEIRKACSIMLEAVNSID